MDISNRAYGTCAQRPRFQPGRPPRTGSSEAPEYCDDRPRETERLLEQRLGRPCVYTPSGRLAIYLALAARLRPGDRLLMSPVQDDVVFFTVLAAGLRPVMAPLSPADGNIDVSAVPAAVWPTLRGVLTTNLYGVPDRIHELRRECDRQGLVLVEDVAHAIETQLEGRPLGTFGDLAAFSLSKHIGVPGGALALSDPHEAEALRQVRDGLLRLRPTQRGVKPALRAGLRAAGLLGAATALVRPLRRLCRTIGLEQPPERTSHRMPLRSDELRIARLAARGLDGFDAWTRVDYHDYRVIPKPQELEGGVVALRRLADDAARRQAGVDRLRALPVAAPGVRSGPPLPLFRVPLLVDRRDSTIETLCAHGLDIYYVYDPPLDDYAGAEFCDPSPAPAVARWWARHVLPVDPLIAGEFLDLLRRGVVRLDPPARAPIDY